MLIAGESSLGVLRLPMARQSAALFAKDSANSLCGSQRRFVLYQIWLHLTSGR